jgi:hypothetical protein
MIDLTFFFLCKAITETRFDFSLNRIQGSKILVFLMEFDFFTSNVDFIYVHKTMLMGFTVKVLHHTKLHLLLMQSSTQNSASYVWP